MIDTPSHPESQRYALVTGAGSGLGREFCLQLARLGWYVGVTDIDLAAAESVCAEVQKFGGRGQAYPLDVTKLTGWRQLADQLQCDWPQLDLLVNNAGICGTGSLGDSSKADFDAIFEVNFNGTLNGCQTLVPWLKAASPSGHLINVASIFGLVAPPTMAAYNCSKAAVVALSETLYGELRPHGIGVTVVAPGFFDSQLVARGRFESDADRETAEQYVHNSTISAAEVVQRTLAAANKGKLYVVMGRKARWIWRLKRLLPNRFARMLAWRYRRKMENASD